MKTMRWMMVAVAAATFLAMPVLALADEGAAPAPKADEPMTMPADTPKADEPMAAPADTPRTDAPAAEPADKPATQAPGSESTDTGSQGPKY